MRSRLLALACAIPLTLAACSSEEESPAADGPFDPGWTAVECDHPVEGEDRELLESLLVEPGPHSGDDFDVDAAAEAAAALGPEEQEEWVEAIRVQVQGDYADDACRMLGLGPDEVAAEDAAEAEEIADRLNQRARQDRDHARVVGHALEDMGELERVERYTIDQQLWGEFSEITHLSTRLGQRVP